MNTEPIVFRNDEERGLWLSAYRTLLPSHFHQNATEGADAAVRALRVRTAPPEPTASPAPAPGPRVVQCRDGYYLIVRGPGDAGTEWWCVESWQPNDAPDKGVYGNIDEAYDVLNSLTPAQLAAPVGVEVKA